MGFLDFLDDLKDNLNPGVIGAKVHQNKKAIKAGAKLGAKTALGTGFRGPARKASSKPTYKRQALTPEKLVIDPATGRKAQQDYFDRMAQEEEVEDPLESLFAQLEQGYQGTRPGFDNSEAMAALDAALGNTLQGINGIRDTTNANYKESDANLESMHRAHQNDIATNGAKTYNGIADSLVGSIQQNRDESVGTLTNMEDESRAKRTAMLKSLGIAEAGAAPESTVLKDAAANIVSRSSTDDAFAESQRANNLSYNTGLAASVGSEGNQRRAALQQQLLKANSTIDAQEMDVRSQYQNQKAQLANQAAGAQNDIANFEYGMYQDEQNGIRDMIDQFTSATEESKPVATKGYAGLAQDLANSGVDQTTASQAIRSHAEIIASEDYLKARQKGQDPTSWVIGQMTKRGIPVSVAMQYVTNYNNLGSTSGYSAVE